MLGYFGALGLVASDLFLPSEIAFFQKVWPTVRVAANWTDPNWGSIGYPSGPPISALSNAIMGAVWGDVRRAAQFSDINWSAVPELTQAMVMAAEQITHPPPVVAPVPEVTSPTVTQPVTTTTTQPTQPTMRTPETSPTAQPVNVDTTSPAAAPVPEAQQPTTPYVDASPTPVYGGGTLPMLTDPGYGFVLPGTAPDSSGGATLTPAGGAIKQAGMFGGYTNLVYVGLAIGAALMFGTHGGGKKRGRRRKRA